MRQLLLVVALFIPLAGCISVDALLPTARAATAAERDAIVQYVRNTFRDPYTIRDAVISPAVSRHDETAICVVLNAKNGFGGYVGRRPVSFVFRDGAIVRSTVGAPACYELAVRALHTPFPELEAIG